jgi:Cu2+-exporting ATPase
MSLSSFTVCMNALRLNLFKVHDSSKDRPLRKKALPETEPVQAEPEEETITEVYNIGGMMCEHCEARIQKAIGALDGVISVKADHPSGTATVITAKELDPKDVEKAVTDQDYEYIGKQGEEKTMKETVRIEGMMCPHCEASVKKALEAIDGIESAEVSHEKGTAEITLSKEVAADVIQQAIEAKDYKFVSIE